MPWPETKGQGREAAAAGGGGEGGGEHSILINHARLNGGMQGLDLQGLSQAINFHWLPEARSLEARGRKPERVPRQPISGAAGSGPGPWVGGRARGCPTSGLQPCFPPCTEVRVVPCSGGCFQVTPQGQFPVWVHTRLWMRALVHLCPCGCLRGGVEWLKNMSFRVRWHKCPSLRLHSPAA